jgi:hypothetical protein
MANKLRRKNTIKLMMLAIILTLSITNLHAETGTWKKEISEDGNSSVEWNVSANGDGYPIIEYTTSTTAEVGIHAIVSLLKDVKRHKNFNEDEVSKMVEKISDNEWLIYYYNEAPWPFKGTEIISRMVLTEDRNNKMARFELTAEPHIDFPVNDDAHRITTYHATYTLKGEGNGTHISLASRTVASSKIPRWMISAWFPEGPLKTMTRLVELAKAEQ